MAKVQASFQYDIFKFLHKPLQTSDKEVQNFLERFVGGPQVQFEEVFAKINKLPELYDPAKTPQPLFLKDIVGFTKELDNITQDLSESDIRKLIQLAVPLWKKMGLEVGYSTIIRLFTGKNTRTFNWFDFRYIVGEQSLAQEELGEDSWIVSIPGVQASTPSGNVVGLWPFEGNLKDRSLSRNDAVAHGNVYFFTTGPVAGSAQYMSLAGDGVVRVPHSVPYVFSGSFTIEMFIRTGTAQNAVVFRKAYGTKYIEIRYNSTANTITYTLYDGTTAFTETMTPIADLDSYTWRHVALIVNRGTPKKARLYLDGTISTGGVDITAMGGLPTSGDIFIGGSSVSTERLVGDIDNVRLSLSAQYDLTAGTIPPPANTFIEFQEEELDEFFTDIRIVDNGDLNRTLVKRVLNLMRPPSERLRLIYIKFFESFEFGKGALATVVPGATAGNKVMTLPAGAVEVADVIGAEDFQDIVLQIRFKLPTAGIFAVRFNVQDSLNFYRLTVDSTTGDFILWKVVGGVPTAISSPVNFTLFNDTFYIITVLTDYNNVLGETQIKVLLDGNVINKITDSTYVKGSWGVENAGSTVVKVSHIEMFTMPLETETIRPNAVI